MGKEVSGWQAFISCSGGSLTICHLKRALAEDLEIPWPAKLKSITCKKVRFSTGVWSYRRRMAGRLIKMNG